MKNLIEDNYLTYLKIFLLAVYSVLVPVMPILSSLSLIIGCSTALGLACTVKSAQKLSISQILDSLLSLAMKAFTLIILIVGTYEFEILSGGYVKLVTFVATAYALRELKTMIGSAETLLGGKIFQSILQKIESFNLTKPKGGKDG